VGSEMCIRDRQLTGAVGGTDQRLGILAAAMRHWGGCVGCVGWDESKFWGFVGSCGNLEDPGR
jgi:hypothetical protein